METPPFPQDQPFTRSMAREEGLSDKQLMQWCREGLLRRPVRGLYLHREAVDSMELRLAALSLVVPADCFIADHTAAWLHAGDVALPPNAHLSLPVPSIFRHTDCGRLRNGLTRSGERTVSPDDLMEMGGLLVTTPLRTAWDLGRLQRPDLALAGMDQMLALGVFSHAELVHGVRRFARQRGVVQLRRLAPKADGRSESFGESALRLRWDDAGLPRPELQVPVWSEGTVLFRIDIGLEEDHFGAEYDGARWHTEAERDHDQSRRNWMRDERGWWIEVFRSAHVFGAQQDAIQRLAEAHRQARARRTVTDLGGNWRRLGG